MSTETSPAYGRLTTPLVPLPHHTSYQDWYKGDPEAVRWYNEHYKPVAAVYQTGFKRQWQEDETSSADYNKTRIQDVKTPSRVERCGYTYPQSQSQRMPNAPQNPSQRTPKSSQKPQMSSIDVISLLSSDDEKAILENASRSVKRPKRSGNEHPSSEPSRIIRDRADPRTSYRPALSGAHWLKADLQDIFGDSDQKIVKPPVHSPKPPPQNEQLPTTVLSRTAGPNIVSRDLEGVHRQAKGLQRTPMLEPRIMPGPLDPLPPIERKSNLSNVLPPLPPIEPKSKPRIILPPLPSIEPRSKPRKSAGGPVVRKQVQNPVRNPVPAPARDSSQAPLQAAVQEPIQIPQGPQLSKEQLDLIDLVMRGRNVFFTGSAGTGKSTVLKEFVRRLEHKGKNVNIIAPTGRAALDINGSTTWTYAGWTPDSMKKPIKEILKAAHGTFVNKRLRETKVLVIDEISMVENFHFARLNALMKEARGNPKPFGGVQLIVTGDFCQLPPVKPFKHCYHCGKELAPLELETVFKCQEHGTFYEVDKWAFRSQAWKECRFKHVQLTHIHRQSDEKFIRILQKCRISVELSEKDKDILLNHKSNTRNAVKLFSTREEVGRINQVEFSKLTTKKYKFSCNDFFRWNSEKHRHLESKGTRMYDGSLQGLRDHRYETKLELKVGMLVVLLANIDIPGGLVNGSQGTIVHFKKHEPSDLAALRPKEGLKPDSGAAKQSQYASMKEAAVHAFISKAAEQAWPVVRFHNGAEKTIIADCTINELGDEKEYSLLSRTQIPLSAAWAMSIHKAQGMTLDTVIVDLSRSFEEGQMYVALSRARSLEGLKVEGLGNWQGKGNAQVKEFLSQNFGI